MKRTVRKPLVIFTPKSYLRRPESRSPIGDLTHGSFAEIVDDAAITDRDAVRRIVFCSGKVAYDALAERDKRGAPVAIVRIEQLFPFPQEQLLTMIESYPNARQLLWLQEEPENMGPWHFVFHRAHTIASRGYELLHAARVESGSPATGSSKIHEQELADLMDEVFAAL
jgi:multifunctional 2-oxoglutarate metabolism enzyme